MGPGVTVLKVGSAGAADKQSVSAKNPVVQSEGIGVVCVARGVNDIKAYTFNVQFIAIGQP